MVLSQCNAADWLSVGSTLLARGRGRQGQEADDDRGQCKR